MVRKIAGVLALVCLAAGFALAGEDKQDDKKDSKEPKFSTVIGKFESYQDEILKLKVETLEGGKLIKEEKEFKVPGETPVGYTAGQKKQTVLKAKEHLKDVKKGSIVAVTLDDKKKVLGIGVVVSELPKEKSKGKEEDKDK